MNVIEMWVSNFVEWEPLGQAIFILLVLVVLTSFVTVLVRGYPTNINQD